MARARSTSDGSRVTAVVGADTPATNRGGGSGSSRKGAPGRRATSEQPKPARSSAPKPRPALEASHVDAGPMHLPAGATGDGATLGSATVHVGDCRDVLPRIDQCEPAKRGGHGLVDLVFADPPFNWNRAYDQWDDAMPRQDYLEFTAQWLDLCRAALRPGGAMWVNIPDDTAAEIVVHLKKPDTAREQPALEMVNWCIWHYRFGQNTTGRFINSKVHALYFVKPGVKPGVKPNAAGDSAGPERGRTWDPSMILEPSDRASTYFDPRTLSKRDGMPAGRRVPLDVWYGPYWGRIQGNNKERRHGHDNQLPEAYLERVILSTSAVGDLVLDPFLGSGTTGVVARALGRHFIGVEFSLANAARAFDRIRRGPVDLGKARGVASPIHGARSASAAARKRFALPTAR